MSTVFLEGLFVLTRLYLIQVPKQRCGTDRVCFWAKQCAREMNNVAITNLQISITTVYFSNFTIDKKRKYLYIK